MERSYTATGPSAARQPAVDARTGTIGAFVSFYKAETLALTILLALITSIGPLATDMYLPALPDIRASLEASTAETQATLSGFLVGYALAQLLYGPLSDRKGRKPAMLFGLGLFTVGSLACAMAPGIQVLIGARVLQALGGAGSVVLARAMVRDLYEGARAGRELSRMGSIMAIVPALAPILGAAVGALWGWRSIFYVMTLSGPVLALMVHRRLPETLRAPLAEPFSLLAMLRGFALIFRSATFRYYAFLGSLSFAGFFCFLSGASLVLQTHYGVTPFGFSIAFAVVTMGFIGGALLAGRKVMAWGIDGTLWRGVCLLVPAGLLMLAVMLTGWGGAIAIVAAMTLYQVGFALTLPQCNAGAMMPFRERAGSASSLFSVIQMTMAALAGALVGSLLDRTPLMLPLGISACALTMLAIVVAGRRRQAPPAG